MTQASEHFAIEEFQKDEPIPEELYPIFIEFAQSVLEPIRAFVDKKMQLTSGYRSEEANEQAHGQPNSEHVATSEWCACDFFVVATTFDLTVSETKRVFNWLLTNSAIPYHQLILEAGSAGSFVIHVSMNKAKGGIRSTKIGSTHNATPYVDVEHVAFVT